MVWTQPFADTLIHARFKTAHDVVVLSDLFRSLSALDLSGFFWRRFWASKRRQNFVHISSAANTSTHAVSNRKRRGPTLNRFVVTRSIQTGTQMAASNAG